MDIVIKYNAISTGNLILVNAQHPIIASNSLQLTAMHEENVLLECGAARVLTHVFDKLKLYNKIKLVSGYRSKPEQEAIYSDSILTNGIEFTKKYVAMPNFSEHQTGLAIDLGLTKVNIDFICPEFPTDGACGQFRKAAAEFGFIERYQVGKQAITGIAAEPWHFRFVGYPHSKFIDEQNITLEEYIELVKNYTYKKEHLSFTLRNQKIEAFYVPALDKAQTISLPENCLYQISGNNIDGFIITLWSNI